MTGDIDGQFKEVFAKLVDLNKKQNFAFVIVAGNFFKEDGNAEVIVNADTEDLISGKIEIPIPVYFTLGRQVLPPDLTDELDANNGELCPNVFALGRRAHTKTTEGITIVAISGRHMDGSQDRPSSLYAGGYTDNDVKGSCSYSTAGILITSDWPAYVNSGCRMPCAGPMGSARSCIAELCSALKPRYHLSTSQAFYQRQPFFHNVENKPITRFFALAPFGNRLGEKSLYAFLIDPAAQPPAQLPPDVTASPLTDFSVNNKRKLASQQEAYKDYRFSTGGREEEPRTKRKKTASGKKVMPSACFFCLSNPSCETHMIGSIGEESYITVAKGPLTKHDTYPDLGFSGHMLIVPLVHAPTIAAIPGKDSSKATFAEMTRYKEALQQMVVSRSKDKQGHSKLGAVVWEISRAGGVHNHWQFLPVPLELVQKGTIEAAFKAEADSLDWPAFMTEDDKVAAVEQGNCFKVEIWSEGSTRRMAMPLDVSFKFDLQFGRSVMAKLLGLSSRLQWKLCAQEQSEEEVDVAQFKHIFKEFDFSDG